MDESAENRIKNSIEFPNPIEENKYPDPDWHGVGMAPEYHFYDGGFNYQDWQTITCWTCSGRGWLSCNTCGGFGAVNVCRDGTIIKLKKEESEE